MHTQTYWVKNPGIYYSRKQCGKSVWSNNDNKRISGWEKNLLRFRNRFCKYVQIKTKTESKILELSLKMLKSWFH